MAHILGSGTEKSVGKLGGLTAFNRTLSVSEAIALQAGVALTGLTADLQPSNIQIAPGEWIEQANGAHAILPEGARTLEQKQTASFKSVNTFTASTVGQPLGNADVPILPQDARIGLSVKASDAGTFDIGDGVDQDRYAAGVTIGTEWSDVALLTPFHDGTNRKIVLTPTVSYTGVVTSSVKVELL